jgi:hypothetical protein
MKLLTLVLFLVSFVFINAQTNTNSFEKYPVFPDCETKEIDDLENCFNKTLQDFIYKNFNVPEIVSEENYNGSVSVFFEVDKEGVFKVLYVDGVYTELKNEARHVFEQLPTITPATYNGNPAYVQFTFTIAIPLQKPSNNTIKEGGDTNTTAIREEITTLKQEYDEITNLAYENEEYTSVINIPLSHHNYSLFDPALNRVGQNNHTAQKPFIYSEVNKYYNFETENAKLLKNKESWFGRKFWDEHMVTIKGEDYWITLDPGIDLQVGKDLDQEIDTYNNTRLVYTQGGLGKTSIFLLL